MSKEQQRPPAAPAEPRPPDLESSVALREGDAMPAGLRREPIPVAILYFEKPTDIPGKHGASSVTSGRSPNGSGWDVEFLPWLRHHRVTFHPHGKEPAVVRMVSTERAPYWDPPKG